MKKNKEITMSQALEFVKDGARIMVGGFIGCGGPNDLMEGLFERGTKSLTMIANDATRPEFGIGKLVAHGRIKKLITTHIGTNPEAGRLMNSGEMEVELVPQGTFAERIRAGGAGLGGVITPTGVGTLVEEGKQTIILSGKKYLIELPLRAEIAFVAAKKADQFGNLVLEGATRNSNMVIATAADIVIAEVEEIVEVGEIPPDHVTIPGVYVDYLVKKGGARA